MSERERSGLGIEVLIVLGLSLGQSAVYSVLSLINKLTQNRPLASQTTTMNSSATPDRPWLDLSYQLANNVFPLVSVALVLYLLRSRPGPLIDAGPGSDRPRLRGIAAPPQLRGVAAPPQLRGVAAPPQLRGIAATGLHRPARPAFDLLGGLGLAAAIAVPGLLFYLAARGLGLNTNVAPANLAENWWTVPVLLLAALSNGALEEVVIVGYLFTRLRQLGWSWPVILIVSALIRGSYHLYQGFGGFAGNVIMGVIFGLVFLRWRRVGPLVAAHTYIDVGAFVGYALLASRVSWL